MISKERKEKVLYLSNNHASMANNHTSATNNYTSATNNHLSAANDHTSGANGCIKTISIKNKCQKKGNST
jgi:hypothetical protein